MEQNSVPDTALSDDQLDEIVQFEFPYPVAIAYSELLQTKDLIRQADLCIKTFHFGIRAITLSLIIRYLRTPSTDINMPELNRKIREYLPSSRPHQWIELLRDVLRAYKNHRERMLMPELYDLYWSQRDTVDSGNQDDWALLERFAAIANDISAGRVNRAAKAAELRHMLRGVIRAFMFLRSYSLWRVVSKHEGYLAIDLHNGVTIRRIHVYSEHIIEPDFSLIKVNCYYITDRQGHLLELDPLLIDPHILRGDSTTTPDIGVFDAFYAQDGVSDEEGMLQYLLLAADIKAETNDQSLVAKFLDLYEHQLSRKERTLSARLPLTWENLVQAIERYSRQQLANALSKYDGALYVERLALHRILHDFLSGHRSGLVITGDAGVGKTNFLVHEYLNKLTLRSDLAVLWLDGSDLNAQRTIVQQVIEALDTYINFGEDPSGTPEQAWRCIRHLFDGPLFGRSLVVILEAVNENSAPIDAFKRVNEFVNSGADLGVKVIVTSRPQIWRYMRQHGLKPFRQANYYSRFTASLGSNQEVQIEHDSFVLRRFDRTEQEAAFALYAAAERLIDTQLDDLNERLSTALRDPLLMRIVCEAYKGRSIPRDLSVEEIMPRLIERMIEDPSQALTLADVEDFLERRLVPQFLPPGGPPVNRLSRNVLRKVQVGLDKTLDDLVSDKSPYSDGTAVNQQFQELMNTGWLVRLGTPLNYDVRFRYEYFYDYFVGKYLTELCRASHSPKELIAGWVAAAENAPFMWGAVRNMLVSAFEDGHQEVIRDLCISANSFRKDLLVSVLITASRIQSSQVEGLIRDLLSQRSLREHSSFAPVIALEAAYELLNSELLAQGICHPSAELRAISVQLVYQLWLDDNADTALTVLRRGVEHVKLLRLRGASYAFEGAVTLSILIAFADYERHGLQRSNLADIQRLWQPVIRRFRFLFGVRPRVGSRRILRRMVMRLLTAAFIRDASDVDRAQQLVFSVEDVRMYFPPDGTLKDITKRLLPYLDGANSTPGSLDLDELITLCRQVLEGKDMLTTLIAFAALTACCIGHPEEMMSRIVTLFEHAKELGAGRYGGNGKSIAPILAPQLTMVGQNVPYYDLADTGRAAELLTIYGKLVLEYEQVFGGTNQGRKRRYYWSDLAEYSCWHYRIHGSAVSPVMQTVLQAICQEKNEGKLRFHLHRFAHVARCSLWRSPEVALAGIREIMVRADRPLQDKLINVVAECVADIRAVAPEYVDDFLTSFTDDILDSNLRERIRSMRPRIDLGYMTGDAAIVFAKAFLGDQDPTVRDFVKMFILRATESRSLQGWMSWLIMQLADYVRDSALMSSPVIEYSSLRNNY